MIGLAVTDAGEVRLKLLPDTFFAALALVPFVDEDEVAPVAEDRGGDCHSIALLRLGQLVDVDDDHGVRVQTAEARGVAIHRISKDVERFRFPQLVGVLARQVFRGRDQNGAVPCPRGVQHRDAGVQHMGLAGSRGHPEGGKLQVVRGEGADRLASVVLRPFGEEGIQPFKERPLVGTPAFLPMREQDQ